MEAVRDSRKVVEAYKSFDNLNPMEVLRNSKEPFVRPKQLIWNGGTYRQTHRQTDPCIELRYAQLTSPHLKSDITARNGYVNIKH